MLNYCQELFWKKKKLLRKRNLKEIWKLLGDQKGDFHGQHERTKLDLQMCNFLKSCYRLFHKAYLPHGIRNICLAGSKNLVVVNNPKHQSMKEDWICSKFFNKFT